MEIPLLDLKAQYSAIKKEVDEVLSRVVESQIFILSDEVSGLEKEVAQYTKVPYTAGVASGTDALILSLKAAGIGKGDMVITTPFTFFATAESVSLLGATPAFADIDPGTYNIDPASVEKVLSDMDAETKLRVKAILPVHLYGQCADMDSIMRIAGRYDLKVIEDCCQAIGATFNGEQAGSFGVAGCFSFFPSKNLGGFGDGGMVISNEKDVIDRVKVLRVHGSKEQYIHEEIGYNSRLDSLQAAVLRIKLRKLDSWIENRKRIASLYNEAFGGMEDVTTPVTAQGNTHTYHQYTIAVEDRNGLLQYLNAEGIAARVYYPVPLHLQPCYKNLGYSVGSLPVSERASEKVLSLPVYPELTGRKIEYVIDTVRGYYSK